MRAVLSQEINGTVYDFPRLTPAECMELCARIYEARRASLMKDLEFAKADAQMRMERLDELRAKEGTDELLLEYAKGVGAAEIINRSIAHMSGNKPTGDVLSHLNRMDRFSLAGQLCGFVKVDDRDDDDDDGVDRGNPPSAGGAIGSGKPA